MLVSPLARCCRIDFFCLLGVCFVGGGFFPLFADSSSAGETKFSVVEKDQILAAPGVARGDDVGNRWCGRGTLSVLTSLGLATGLKGADGHDWEENLWRGGWRPVACLLPSMAPYGSVLVYDSDYRLYGSNRRGTPGGRWGHVEFVSWENGKRSYVSDSPRTQPGGTVLNNFTKRAWVPPSFVELYVRLQGRDLPFAGYVYRGPKGDGPGTDYPHEGSDFGSPAQYVLLASEAGRSGGEDASVGRGDGSMLALGPGVVGPNPSLGSAIPYEGPSGVNWEVRMRKKLKDPDFRLSSSDAVILPPSLPPISMGNQDYLLMEDRHLESSPPAALGSSVVESPGVVAGRVSLLVSFRLREANQLLEH